MGKMLEWIHEGDTLSSLLAEQEAVEDEVQVCRRRLGQVDVGTPDHERKKSLSCGAAKAVWNELLIWLVLRSISRLQGEPLG
jgi:hypothetical protein